MAPGASIHGSLLTGSLVEAFLPAKGRVRSHVRKLALASHPGRFEPARVEGEHDICLFVCQFPQELANLRRVRGWRERSRFAAAFILETWSSLIERNARELKLLDEFDHVFVLNAGSIPEIQRHTRTPVSFLATAADAIAACPTGGRPERVIDILALGRHCAGAHERMLEVAERRNLFYLFDAWSDLQARDWGQIRKANAGMIQRSRYFVVWSPAEHLQGVRAHEVALTSRYFEGAAGGAVLIGTPCRTPEFDRLMGGPEAIVEIAPDGSDFEAVFSALEADPERQAALGRRNQVMALRCNDWSHRWAEILSVAGEEPTAAHRQRLQELSRRAWMIEEDDAPTREVFYFRPQRAAGSGLRLSS